jgi:hypothetical protein
MTANEIRATKSLPDEYVLDGTWIATFDGTVLAIHPDKSPIIYENQKWRKPIDKAESNDAELRIPPYGP